MLIESGNLAPKYQREIKDNRQTTMLKDEWGRCISKNSQGFKQKQTSGKSLGRRLSTLPSKA